MKPLDIIFGVLMLIMIGNIYLIFNSIEEREQLQEQLELCRDTQPPNMVTDYMAREMDKLRHKVDSLTALTK